MKKMDLQRVLDNTPQMVPLFRVMKVSPRLAGLGVEKGDTFYYHNNGCYVPRKSKCQWNTDLGASQVEFIGYVDNKFFLGVVGNERET